MWPVQNVENANDPTSHSFQVVRLWREDGVKCEGAEAVAKMKEKTSPEVFTEPFNSAIQWMPEDSSPVFIRQLQYWPTIPWNNRGGKVTLAGDAAHCMLPSKSTEPLNRCVAKLLRSRTRPQPCSSRCRSPGGAVDQGEDGRNQRSRRLGGL